MQVDVNNKRKLIPGKKQTPQKIWKRDGFDLLLTRVR